MPQQPMTQRRGPTQAEDECHPEAKQQRAEPGFARTADEDERDGKNQGAVGKDEVIEAPLGTENEIRAAGMGNRSLVDRMMKKLEPERKQYDADDHTDC